MPITLRLIALAGLAVLAACDGSAPRNAPSSNVSDAGFIGSAACGNCHTMQFERWRGSHHDLAMQHARPGTVLGNFSDRSFDYFGTRSRFFVLDDRYFVTTDNASGDSGTFEIRYTFGVFPLQQYLVEYGRGRLQALPFAWDARAATDGGQRWYHLYPDEHVAAGDPLHWTGRDQNWNYQCAECHSTQFRMNYDRASDSFASTFAEIDVGCEACHGPGSVHRSQARSGHFSDAHGLPVDLDDRGRAAWITNMQTGIAERSELRMQPPRQPEACGRCHARRGRLVDEYEFGQPLTQTHMPSLLTQPLYFADGQIRDEVYVYGSFLQSRMYRAGVSCSDCHDPHSLELVTGGGPDSVCVQCHRPERFDARLHHGHGAGEAGCVDCHMPSRTYMGIDERRDHSFRIPRPDLTISTGVPNACTACHGERDASWAVAALRGWGLQAHLGDAHFATALAATEQGANNRRLLDAIGDADTPGIAQATALEMLSAPLPRAAAGVIAARLDDPDPLVRIGALRATRQMPAGLRARFGARLLDAKERGVRIEAAIALADVHRELPPASTRDFERAASEYRHAQASMLNRPEAHANLGSFEAALGNLRAARDHFEDALRLQADFTAALINLVDVLRQMGDDAAGEQRLRDALDVEAGNAALRHALGLLLVRTKRRDAAIEELGRAAALDPDNPRHAYVFGVALNSTGNRTAAIDVLAAARRQFPTNYDIGWALATIFRDGGDLDAAVEVTDELSKTFPGDPNVRALRESLEAARTR